VTLKADPPEEEDDAPALDMAASRRTQEGSDFGGDGDLGRYSDFRCDRKKWALIRYQNIWEALPQTGVARALLYYSGHTTITTRSTSDRSRNDQYRSPTHTQYKSFNRHHSFAAMQTS
jgi:hypothetical protein